MWGGGGVVVVCVCVCEVCSFMFCSYSVQRLGNQQAGCALWINAVICSISLCIENVH